MKANTLNLNSSAHPDILAWVNARAEERRRSAINCLVCLIEESEDFRAWKSEREKNKRKAKA